MGRLTCRLVLVSVCLLGLGSATHLHAQAVLLNPTSLNFGNLAVGTTSMKSVRLTSTATMALVITTISMPSAPFSETDDCPRSPASLARNRFCTISVTFSPTAPGAAPSSSISITDNASSSPQTINLTGTGVQPVTLSPGTYNFGKITLGSSSSPKIFTLKNVQNVSLTISSITASAVFPFTQTNNTCPISPSTLAAGATCSISLVFTPSSLGAASATLTVVHNAYGSPTTASLSGTGINPVALSPSSLTFGAQNIGTTSTNKTIQVTNIQAVALSINSIQTTGNFSETNSCPISPATLAAGGSCSVAVSFSPLAAGTLTGQLLINDNAVGSPQTAALTGTGVAVLQKIVVSPNPASIVVGQP